MHPIRSHRRIATAGRVVALLLIVSLLGSLLPAPPARAIEVQRVIDDTLDDFSQGTFQRTALIDPGTIETDNLELIDGTVQLAQIGTIDELETAFRLPEQLLRFGAAAIGNRIYIAGGQRPTADSQSTEFSADVWSAAVNLNRGAQGQLPSGTSLLQTEETNNQGWRSEGTLPAVIGQELLPISRTHSFGIAAVDNESGNDYLYLIGGEESSDGLGSNSQSSRAVRIAVVADDADAAAGTGGRITRWITSDDEGSTAMRLPHTGSLGVIAPAVTTLTVNGTTYLYVFGGLNFIEGSNVGIRAVGDVYYARVGSDGRLYRAGTSGTNNDDVGWTQLAAIPGTEAQGRGLFEAAIMKSTSVLTPTDQSIFLLGGRQEYDTEEQPPPVAPILQANVNPTDGTIEWVGSGGNLPVPLRGHTAAEYRGSIFVAGGSQTNNEPTQNVLVSYLEDDLSIHVFRTTPDDPGQNFLPTDPDNPTIAEPRSFHQSLTIESFGSAIFYVLGGVGDPNDTIQSDNPAARTVFSQRIISDTLQNPVFINRGWYVSRPVDVELGAPKIIGITWNTEMPESRSADVDLRVQYRTSTRECENADWNENSWQTLDGLPGSDFFSNTGGNSQSFDETEQAIARCFQYRGEFTGTNTESPQLLSLSINVSSDTGPDLFIESLDYDVQTGQLSVNVRNEYRNDPSLTEDADADAPTATDKRDRPIYLDTFIIGSSYNSTWFTPTLPLSSTVFTGTDATLISQAYTTINLDDSGVKARRTFAVPSTSWRRQTDNQPIANFDDFFDQGTYQICVAVDSYVEPRFWDNNERRQFANVTEALNGAEANNTACTEEFQIVRVPPTVSVSPTIQLSASRVITEGDIVEAIQVRRDAVSVTGPLTVALELSGNAAAGTDYDMFTRQSGGAFVPVTNTLVIPAGEEQVSLILEALDNEQVDDERTVTTRIVALPAGRGPEYEIDPNANSVTITIANDDPYQIYLPLVARITE